MNRRIWLLLSTALLAAFAIFGMVNAASASLPAGSSAAAPSTSGASTTYQDTVTKDDPFGIANFNCADISRYGVDKQTNVRAAAILQKCAGLKSQGQDNGSAGKSISGSGIPALDQLTHPFNLGVTDVDVILPDNTGTHITQSETFVWAHGNTVVSTYNDSRTAPSCYSGGSYSTDGGATWTMLAARPFCAGHGTGFGDPTVVWDNLHSKWVASFLASGCGGQGVGAWNSPDGATWTAVGCVLSSSQGDRNSSWVDDNPASPHYGTVYVSYNDFNVGGGALYVGRSTDAGVTWASAQLNPAFIRDVQLTGAADGTVLEAAMNENGGGLGNRNNVFYRSTDGGVTWTSVYTGPAFYGPGRAASGYFAGMFTSPSAYWRHMGWGQPAGGGPQSGGSNVFHYDYAMGIAGTDPGNVMYIRSTDNGVTWSAPLMLNTDGGTRAQWMPSLTVSSAGAVLASWYDERSAACGTAGAATPCWQRYARLSLDNGATWGADQPIGDVISPLPAQPDLNVQPLYSGDYDYSSSDGNTAYTCWDDGRTLLAGSSQQDVYCDRVNVTVGTPTPTTTGTPPTATRTNTPTLTPTVTPTACGGTAPYSIATATGTIVAGTTDTGNHCDDCTTNITIPFSYQLYDQNFTSVDVDSNGTLQFVASGSTFSNTCLPGAGFTYTIFPFWDDLYTINSGFGIFTSVSGTAPNRIFNIEWRDQYFPGTGSVNFEVRLYEGQPRFDVIYGASTDSGVSATSGVQKDGTSFTQYSCDTAGLTSGLMLIYTRPACPTGTNTPTATVTFTPTSTATDTPPATDTPTSTDTPEATDTPTVCPIQFTDVPVGSTFYDYVRCMACRGIVNGYADNTFRPNNNVTRGQLSKIVSNSAGFNDPQTTQMFQDVPVGDTFQVFINRLASRGFISGYPCGGPGEPCQPGNLPYFRPNNNATRGQITKIDSNAAGFSDTPTGQQFEDIAVGSTYYTYTYRLVTRGIMGGYACGGVGEPCGPGNLPYFRPNNNATRGQTSKIVANTFFPNCQTPLAIKR